MKRDDEIDDMLARSPWPGRRVGRWRSAVFCRLGDAVGLACILAPVALLWLAAK